MAVGGAFPFSPDRLMPHETALIATIAAGLGLAFVFGLLAVRLRLPPILGYLLAGVALGPFTPGFVADAGLASQLAELGVILLMFGVGLHFSIGDLLAVRRIAVPGAIGQIAAATALGTPVLAAGGALSAAGAYTFAYVLWRTIDGPSPLRAGARRARAAAATPGAARLPLAGTPGER